MVLVFLETTRNHRSMAACNHWRRVGQRGGGGGAAAPCWAFLTTTFARSVPGWAWTPSTVVFYLGKLCRWASFSFFGIESTLRFRVCAFCYVFHLYSNICPAKHVFSNTSGTRSIVKAYVSKVCLFLLFWTIIGC